MSQSTFALDSIRLVAALGLSLLVQVSCSNHPQRNPSSLPLLAGSENTCVPAVEYLPMAGPWAKPESNGRIALGAYSRISPDGNYVLRSLSGSYLPTVTLMKLPKLNTPGGTVEAMRTPLTNEAFPMMGSWRFLANPTGHYYRFKDIIKSGSGARPQFKAGITGFYATAGEMKTEKSVTTFRTLSWPQGDVDSASGGTGQLQNKISKIKRSQSGQYSVVSETTNVYMCDNLRGSEGTLFTLPMLSQDGSEFSALPVNPSNRKQSMRIYKFGQNQKDCIKVDDVGFAGAKMIFGFAPDSETPAPLVFRGGTTGDRTGTGVYIYDRKIKGSFEINGLPTSVQAEDFPGMAKDGRIIFGGHWQDCKENKCIVRTGYIRVDPYQSKNISDYRERFPEKSLHLKKCVTVSDVKKSEEDFKASSDLP